MDELKKLSTPKNYSKFDHKIVDKEFLLGKFYDSTITSLVSPACKSKHHNIKKFPKSKIKNLLDIQLKIKEQLKGSSKKLKQQKIDKESVQPRLSYEFYQPLNNLWCRYISDLISKEQNQQAKQLKVLRADFHGAKVTVVSSKNQTLVGLNGIVIKQTLRTFEIVVKEKAESTKNTCMILKSISVFMVQIGNNAKFIINGNSLVYRPSDRIRHKFKFKKADELNHQFLKDLDQVVHEDQLGQETLMVQQK